MSQLELTPLFTEPMDSRSAVAGRPSGEIVLLDPARFFHDHRPRLMAIARRILRDATLAEDAVQEAFLSIFRHLAAFRGESRLETWMTRITINACLAYLRRNKPRRAQELPGDVTENPMGRQLSDPTPDALDTTLARDRRRAVQAAVARLKPIHQEVVARHDLKGEPLNQIAEDLGVPPGTVKSRLFYGRRELQRSLRPLVGGAY